MWTNITQALGLAASLSVYAVMVGVGLLLLLFTRNHKASMSFQVRLFLLAFTVRFAMAFILYELDALPQLQEPDATGWVAGVSVLRRWQAEGVGLLGLPGAMTEGFGTRRGYAYLLGSFFYLTGTETRIAAAGLSCLMGAFTVIFAYRGARILFDPAVAARVGWLSCLFPSMIIWSAQTLKEPVVVLLETVALYACLVLRCRGFSMRHAVLCAATIVGLLMFRFYAVYATGAVALLTLVWPHATRRRTSMGSAVVVIAVIVPLLVLSGALARQEVQLEEFDLEFVERFRTNVASEQASGVISQYDLNSPAGFTAGMVVGAAHLMLAPFPWELAQSSRMLYAAPELVVWWWLFFAGVVPGLAYCVRNRLTDVLPLLAFLLGMGLLYSLMFANIGLVYRQRAQLLPWLFIFAAVGLELRARRRLALERAYASSVAHRASLGASRAAGGGY